MWSLYVRRRELWGLLLHWWWRDVLLRRLSSASLPCTRHAERIADAWLALGGWSGADATGRLQLLLRLGRQGLLLILDWHGWRLLHWGCLCLLNLPSLGYLLLLLYHYLLLVLLLLLLLLAIRIRHRIYRDVSMWVKCNTDAVRRGSTILSWTLIGGIDAAAAWGSRRCGRDASGRGMTEGWTARTTIGTDARVSFSANRTLQMITMRAMGRRSCELRCVETCATTVGPATVLAWEALVIRIDDSIYDGRGRLCRWLHEGGRWRRRRRTGARAWG